MARPRSVAKSLCVAGLTLTLVTLQACMLLIPVLIIKHMRTSDHYTATAKIPVAAENVYAAALALANEKGIQILTKDDAGLKLEVTDGVQKASLKAMRLANRSSNVTVTADIPKGKDEKAIEKELALRVLSTVCDRLGVSYTVK